MVKDDMLIVIVLNYVPRPEIFKSYGIPYFEEEGISYQLVLLKENLYVNEILDKQLDMMVDQYGVDVAEDGEMLMAYLQQRSVDFVVTNLNNCYRSPIVFNQIASSYKLVGLSLKGIPQSKKSRMDRVKSNPGRIFKYLKKKLQIRANDKLDLTGFFKIYTSSQSLQDNLLKNASHLSNVNLCASLEFDNIYWAQQKGGLNEENQTCVFLDINLILHPDTQRLSGNVNFSFDHYAEGLRQTFKKIETQLKLRSVICLHPSSDLIVYQKYFPDLELSKGKTIEQIHRSSLVLSHASTATLVAVFYDKPIKVLVSNEILGRSRYRNAIQQWADELKQPVMNMDEIENEQDREQWYSYNKGAYEELKDKYLTPGGVDIPYYKDLLSNFS